MMAARMDYPMMRSRWNSLSCRLDDSFSGPESGMTVFAPKDSDVRSGRMVHFLPPVLEYPASFSLSPFDELLDEPDHRHAALGVLETPSGLRRSSASIGSDRFCAPGKTATWRPKRAFTARAPLHPRQHRQHPQREAPHLEPFR